MEDDNERKKIKISLKTAIILVIVIIAFVCVVIFAVSRAIENNKSYEKVKKPNSADDKSNSNNCGFNPYDDDLQLLKPIIYIYPTEEKEVEIKLLREDKITCSYPKYNNSWNVLAQTNGDLKDLEMGRNLYSLYYESENIVNFNMEKDGFIVNGEEASEFLEEKLAILGLNEREAEEFIIYWLPKLEANKYNYIRFATIDEINKNMPLEITPTPDSIIRVLMVFKGLDNSIDIEEQQLKTPNRSDFTVVEWGGTEIK